MMRNETRFMPEQLFGYCRNFGGGVTVKMNLIALKSYPYQINYNSSDYLINAPEAIGAVIRIF
jgi:hypothetical protein